jgi:hypothetical protein
VVIAYFRSQLEADEDTNLDDLSDELAEFAENLLTESSHAFIFKGMGNSQVSYSVPWYTFQRMVTV